LDQANTQTIASFTGTLLRREKGSNNVVQLVFREKDNNVLCVSSDPSTARLAVGGRYRIEGIFRKAGKRPFIQNPRIQLIKHKKQLAKPVGIILAIVIISTAGAGAMAGHRTAPKTPSAQIKPAASTTTAPRTLGASDVSTPTASAPAADTPAATPPAKTLPATVKSAPSVTQAVPRAAASVPTPAPALAVPAPATQVSDPQQTPVTPAADTGNASPDTSTGGVIDAPVDPLP
jgi:hypothetical protein